MDDFSTLVAAAVVLAFAMGLVMVATLSFFEPVIFFLQLIFFSAVGVSIWGALTNHWLAEYGVWTMYLSGLALMAQMVRRISQK